MFKKIIAVIGARPQFIKHAPIEIAFQNYKDHFELITIHTGQHYDKNMSDIFFDQLNMSPPKYMLQIGSHSHGKQTGRMMESIEAIVLNEKPDGILVYGDTNSTLAGALVASKLHIPVFHVEAGLRSYNKKMPEEVNRILTDHISTILFAPTKQAIDNLTTEGVKEGVYESGDVMYDMLLIAKKVGIITNLKDKNAYYLATIHRPYNTDTKERLLDILNTFNQLDFIVKCPFHPRTVNLAKKYGIDLENFPNIKIIPPISYFENVNLMANAKAIITDSGGIQKEAYFLKKKCITLRPETEWIETLVGGWNTLVFDNLAEIKEILSYPMNQYNSEIYGDGNASDKIINLIFTHFKTRHNYGSRNDSQ